MRLLLCVCSALVAFAQPAFAASAAAEYLMQEHIARACDGDAGTFNPIGIEEVDLTADGASDLILDHGGIECSREFGRSNECGAANCSIYIYVRKGKLLSLTMEVLAVGATVGSGTPPRIELGGTAMRGTSVIRWNGRKFAPVR